MNVEIDTSVLATALSQYTHTFPQEPKNLTRIHNLLSHHATIIDCPENPDDPRIREQIYYRINGSQELEIAGHSSTRNYQAPPEDTAVTVSYMYDTDVVDKSRHFLAITVTNTGTQWLASQNH